MIEEYLRQIDELLSTSPAVRDVEIIRRTFRDTEWEKILHYRYRVFLTDGGLLEMGERLVEMRGRVTTTKYRHHWQDGNGQLLRRWDNAPHHPNIETFPNHLPRTTRDDELGAVVATAGKKEAARQMLTEIYGWFIEGFDTKDLQEAKTLLEELRH